MLHLVGWKTAHQAAQSDATFLALRISFAGGTVLLALIAACFNSRYSVAPDQVARTQSTRD